MITIDQIKPGIRNLSEDLRVQTLQNMKNLIQKHQNIETRFSFDWIGEPEDEEISLTTAEMQHKIHILKA